MKKAFEATARRREKSWKRDVVKVVVRKPGSETRATECRTEGSLHPKRLARELCPRDDKHKVGVFKRDINSPFDYEY
jgi:hypothetical protein